MTASPVVLGTLVDELHALREQKRAKEEELKAIEQEMADKERDLLNRMEREGVSKMSGSAATVSMSESVKPTVEDWNAFYDFIHRHKLYHLLERRPSVLGCRELFESKGAIPGVVPFKQRRLRLTTLQEKSQ